MTLAMVSCAIPRRCWHRLADVIATKAISWGLLSGVAPAGVLWTMSAICAVSAERSVLLDFSCATYESARQVAIAGGWEHLSEKPRDCRFLIGQRIENRIATIVEIVEVLRLPSGRWVQIGRVRRLFGPISYSAGLADDYPMS